ncbi:hypothetical protein QQX98_008149 [Neonectria punicea]|uniref:fumarylacetoacetase n=1 Tax=Neonectria punicea TaxID=979145 RepID=A0ABR1GW28_9HYPO
MNQGQQVQGRVHRCKSCDRVFARAEHLRRHCLSHENRKPNVCRACGSRFGRSDVLRRRTRKCADFQRMAQGAPNTDSDSEPSGQQPRQPAWKETPPAESSGALNSMLDSPQSLPADPPPELGAAMDQALMMPPSMAAPPDSQPVPAAMQEFLGTGDFDDLGFLEDFLLPDTTMFPGHLASMAYEDEAEALPALPAWDSIDLAANPSQAPLSTFQAVAPNARGKLSEPSYFRVLSTSCYEVDEFRKKLYCNYPHEVPNSFRFPSRSRIVRCIVAYFEHFDPHTPIFQHAKFSLGDANPALILGSNAFPKNPTSGNHHGDYVVDVRLLAAQGVFDGADVAALGTINVALASTTLNLFASLSYAGRSFVRDRIIQLLSDSTSALFTDELQLINVKLQGVKITGKPMPNFFAFPTAYNGRTTSVIPSGEVIPRPKGMLRQPAAEGPQTYSFSTSKRFDFEMEMGVIISETVSRGQMVTADEANELIFGFVLLNDWSARDIQFAEMTGMGPYNGKSTATTISHWVVLPQALEETRCQPSSKKAQEMMPSHPDHLRHRAGGDTVTWNIDMKAEIANRNGVSTVVYRSNLRDLYWTPGQMLAHMTSSGSGTTAGDLFGSGTISSPGHTTENPTLGCLFELNKGGKEVLKLKDGREVMWLKDYDEVILTGWTTGEGGKKIGFGEARGMLVPSE